MANPTIDNSTPNAEAVVERPMHPALEIWHHFSKNLGAVIGLFTIVFIVLVAIFADLIAPHSPIEQFRDAFLAPPFWVEGGTTKFLLGTDDVGRDILSRLIYGARYSLFIGLLVVTISLGSGIILGPSLTNAILAVAITYLPHFTRVARAAVMTELTKEYVTASRVSGARLMRLMFKTVLPNCMAPLIVLATLNISNAILDASALGFLGLGAQPPTPEWGSMLADAQEYVKRAWWVVTPMAIMALPRLGPRKAASAMASMRNGQASMASVMREMSASMKPPR